MTPHGQAYAEGRRRLTQLLTPDVAGVPVPACPGWTVHDVIAHLTGICSDVLSGNLDGVATEPWTAAQVAARRDQPLEAVLDEWAQKAPRLENGAAPRAQWVFDFATHEQDVRGALGFPGARDSAAVQVGLGFAVPSFLAAVAARGLPEIQIRAQDLGEAPAAPPQLAATSFELLRALSGRRNEAQLRALDWSVDPEPYLAAFTFGPFVPPAEPLVE